MGAFWPAAAVTLGAGLAVHPAFLNRLLAVIPRLLKKQVIRWKASWADGLALLGLSVLSWGLYGVAYHLFIAALADVPWSLLPQMAGVNALYFHFTTGSRMAVWDDSPRPPVAARLAGVVSIVVWAVAILAGRGMSYTIFSPPG